MDNQSNRNDFSGVVSEIASRLVDVPAGEFDLVLDEILRRTSAFAKSEGAFICQYNAQDDLLSLTHAWTLDMAASRGEFTQNLAVAHTPALMNVLKEKGIFALTSLDDLPPDTDRERALFKAAGVRSLIEAPLGSVRKSFGVFGLVLFHDTRAWTEDQVHLLSIVAQLLTNALHHKHVEDALSNERQLLRIVIDNLPDYIYAKDAKSKFVLNNSAHLRLLKASVQDDVYGKTDYDIFPKDLADQYYFDEQHVIETGQPLVNREESVLTEDGKQRWLLTTKVALRDSEGRPQGIVGMSRDITTRKEMAEEIETHAKLLEVTNAALQARNQELDEFTYIASHDLQEPLRKQVAFSDALREDLAAGNLPEVERDLTVITSAAKRMQTLVRDLLTLSRSSRQTMDWDELDLNECVANALDALQYRIEQEHATIVQTTLPTVRADRTLMVQLYQNLIGNAIKFHGEAAPEVILSVESNDGNYVLGIADNGIGIKKEYLEQIFAPFKRLHGRHEFEGTGIGLAICRKIVERHGGSIWVESVPGQGSHFKFTLPFHYGETGL